MKDIFTFKVGEVYYLEEKQCYSLIVDSNVLTRRYHSDGELVHHICTRVSDIGNPNLLEHIMGLDGSILATRKEVLDKIIASVTIDGKELTFRDDAIWNFDEDEVHKFFPDEPVYVMAADELEAMQCKLFGPKCPLLGGRCRVCKGQKKLPNADRYMIIDLYEQGSD